LTGVSSGDAVGHTVESVVGVDLDRPSLAGPGRHRFELGRPGAARRLVVEMTSTAFPPPTGSAGACGWVGTLDVVDGEASCTHLGAEPVRDRDDPAATAAAAAQLRGPMRSIIGLAERVLEQVDAWDAGPAPGAGVAGG